MCSRSLNCVLAAVLGAVLPIFAVSAALSQEALPWRPGAGGNDAYSANGAAPRNDAYDPNGTYTRNDTYDPNGTYARDDAYKPGDSAQRPPADRAYAASEGYRSAGGQGSYGSRRDSFSDPGEPVRDGSAGYGEPYAPPPGGAEPYDGGTGGPPRHANGYEQGEIVAAGHSFFGAISQNLASAVEYAFKSQGRPNGYILGEDAGGAFVVGLRYGEGTLYTKDAGDHKVFWQGPSIGYDAGAEGSKTMVLVYNLHDPSEIYNRFGGAEGSAYVVGGVSVQFQKYGDVTLGIIRSGVGLRLGANIGYLKYTRSPTWNPL